MWCFCATLFTEMIVKIFLPFNFIFRKQECSLYGDIVIEQNSVSYYIIPSGNNKNCRKLGSIAAVGRKVKDDSILFVFDEKLPNIYLSYINIKVKENQVCNVILYDAEKLPLLCSPCFGEIETHDINILTNLLNETTLSNAGTEQCFSKVFNFISEVKLPYPLQICLQRSSLYGHFLDWKVCLFDNNQGSSKMWKIFFDIVLGILVTMVALNIDTPADWLIKIFSDAISQLRVLLRSLKGNPIGLKLNVPLNNFFLDCFIYHIDLWAIFLVIVTPALQHLFMPVIALGLFGLSFQLAILSDLVVLVILHAHCFYIYAALLYNIVKVGIEAMLEVVLGRRKNILKDRVVSHNYKNRQLYLATMFFTTLLFLAPTILVYYIVFAAVRICVYFVNYIILKIRREILKFPVQCYFKWILGSYYDLSYAEIELLLLPSGSASLYQTVVFHLQVKQSSPWKNTYMRSKNCASFYDIPSPKKFLIGIARGKMSFS